MQSETTTIWAIMPAAGSGARMGALTPKQYLLIHGKTLIEYSITPLLHHENIAQVIVPISQQDSHWQTISLSQHPKVFTTIGKEVRCDSVRQGLLQLTRAKPDDWVLVHDAVRPCLSRELLQKLIDDLIDHPVGGLLALPPSDTLKRANDSGQVVSTVDRSSVWRAQTPQMFRFKHLSQALDNHNNFSDESEAIEALGLQPKLIPSSPINIKVTQPEDMLFVEKLLLSPNRLEIY